MKFAIMMLLRATQAIRITKVGTQSPLLMPVLLLSPLTRVLLTLETLTLELYLFNHMLMVQSLLVPLLSLNLLLRESLMLDTLCSTMSQTLETMAIDPCPKSGWALDPQLIQSPQRTWTTGSTSTPRKTPALKPNGKSKSLDHPLAPTFNFPKVHTTNRNQMTKCSLMDQPKRFMSSSQQTTNGTKTPTLSG